MNTAAKGRRNEYKSIKILEASGYLCTRAAASKGTFDLIGVGSTDVVLVQVKSNAWPGAVELEAMSDMPAPDNCRKLIHRWRDGAHFPDVKEL